MLDTDVESSLAEKLSVVMPHLNERQRRLIAAAEAKSIGYGGVAIAARASGLSRPAIYRGLDELERPESDPNRSRIPGAGRKSLVSTDPALCKALKALLKTSTRGDPTGPLLWTTRSTRNLADALREKGHLVSHVSVEHLLSAELGYSLHANSKTTEGHQHPDRDRQFHYINSKVRSFTRSHDPVISVDTKRKELVGNYKNPGRQWRAEGDIREVNTHDFPDLNVSKAVPYGIYDVNANKGWVEVGTDHDTAAFAVSAIRAWWHGDGAESYPHANRLLITADSGGSNSYRSKLWKKELGAFSQETGLAITVCHFPPGTSKWNKIEHRLFAAISTNWQGRPLTSHEVIVKLIGSTKTREGLVVHSEIDRHKYPKGIKVTNEEIESLNLKRHKFHPEWNYTLQP